MLLTAGMSLVRDVPLEGKYCIMMGDRCHHLSKVSSWEMRRLRREYQGRAVPIAFSQGWRTIRVWPTPDRDYELIECP